MMPDVFAPKLYPADGRMNTKWFIRYFEKDFTHGLKKMKYFGLLNLEPDVEKRKALAAKYIGMIQRGEPLPNYAGKRTLPPVDLESNFASVRECVKKFLEYHSRGISHSTASQYASNCQTLVKWLDGNGMPYISIGKITRDHVKQFMMDMQKLGRENRTINGYKVLFGSIWQEYVSDGKIKQNPWRQVKSLPKETEHYKSFTPELRRLVRDTLPVYDPQLWLFLQCVYYCGIRPRRELQRMKVKHFFSDTGVFFVPAEISKTKKPRVINIYSALLAQMVAKEYHKYNPEFYLFTKDGQPGPMPAGRNYFGNRWVKYREAFNIPAEFKVYGSKHTGGKALSKQFNQYITQEHFGHSSPETTQHYISELGTNELHFLQKDFPEF